MQNEATKWEETAQLVMAMLADDFDWEAHNGDDLHEEFQRVFKIVPSDYKADLFEFGSHRCEDTAGSMYRLLWLCQPKTVNFSDMYKSHLFSIMPQDESCVVQVYLYKYELALYFFARKADIVRHEDHGGLYAGFPGADNGVSCANPNVNLFTELIVKLAETPHLVYGGNDFEV